MANVYSKINRLRDWLWWFNQQHPQTCYICGEAITTEAILKGDAADGITLHHISMDREEGEPENLRFVHRGCHQKFHKAWENEKIDVRTPKAKQLHGETPLVESSKKRVGGYFRAQENTCTESPSSLPAAS